MCDGEREWSMGWDVWRRGVVWSRQMQGKRKGKVCTANVFLGMEKHRGTWMKGVQDSVESWEGRNNETCLDLCVCTRKC